MDKILICSLSILLFTLLIVNIGYADAAANTHYIFGAKSDTGVANQKGAQTTFEIFSPQTFTRTGEDHNWHIEGRDDDDYTHLFGYFVNEASPSTPKWFVEVFNSTGKVFELQGMGAVGTNGQKKDFAFHQSGCCWQYFVDDSVVVQSINSTATTLNSSFLFVLAEKICPNSPYCTKDEGGPMPSMTIDDAIRYTSTPIPLNEVWITVKKASSFYKIIDSSNAPHSDDFAVTESCLPMSMKGNAQDHSLNFQQLVLGDDVVTTCTPRATILWDECSPPVSGDWTISTSCTLTNNSTVTGNVVVQNNASLIVEDSIELNINFLSKHLKIIDGSRAVIKLGGTIT